MAFQSLTTMPSKPQRSRSWPRTRAGLAVVGTPPMSLNAVMNEPAPAVRPAWKGGSTTSFSVRSEISALS